MWLLMLLGIESSHGFVSSTARRLPRLHSAAGDLEWRREAESVWSHRIGDAEYAIHYIRRGKPTKPIVLVHGFGASLYHWRSNVAALSESHSVFALDLLGFGLSDKPKLPYSASLWSRQICDFVQEVVKEPAVVVGNSLGGYIALSAAAERPDLFEGVCLINAAGRFAADEATVERGPLNPLELVVQKLVFFVSFALVSQKKRVEGILKSVYPARPDRVDAQLVDAIHYPSTLADSEVYRLVVTRPGGPGLSIDRLLERNTKPILLLWGLDDPWIRPSAADKIMHIHNRLKALSSSSSSSSPPPPPPLARVDLRAGHCPHDECPDEANAALLDWLDTAVTWD